MQIECGILEMLVGFLQDLEKARLSSDGDVDTHMRLLAMKVGAYEAVRLVIWTVRLRSFIGFPGRLLAGLEY